MAKDSKILLIVLFFFLMYGSLYGQYLNNYDDYFHNNASGFALINLVLCAFIMMIIPFILRLINKRKFSIKKGKRICRWNSIILFIISVIVMVITGTSFIGGLGALMFYFINKWIFVEEKSIELDNELLKKTNKNEEQVEFMCDNCGTVVKETDKECPHCESSFVEEKKKKPKKEKQKAKPKNKNEVIKTGFVCDNCGTMVKESDKKCPKCGESFEDSQEENSSNNMNKKYSDLQKLKQLLDDKIITKAEFDKEKKKILK